MPEISQERLAELLDMPPQEFFRLMADTLWDSIGHKLDSESMQRLNPSQITLLAYDILRGEMLEGGFVQLIHNGYGPFIFENPFAKAMRLWGIKDLCNIVYDARRLYEKCGEEIGRDCGDEEFMALYERFEEFDSLDDEFVDRECEFTDALVAYVKGNIGDFVELKNGGERIGNGLDAEENRDKEQACRA